MKFFLEILPAAAFLAGYFVPSERDQAMYIAIVATIAATIVTVLVWRVLYGNFNKTHVVSLVALLVLGGGSLLLRDKSLFLWKPTLVYVLFAVALLISQLLHKPLVKITMGKLITMPDHLWIRFNTAWALFFLFLGVLNMVVAWNFSEQVWVNFKIFGTTGLMMLFMLAQVPFISKLATPVEEGAGE